jgi:CrcB protein
VILVLTLLAGATGAVSRFVLDAWIKGRWRSPFPWGTVLINVTGSLLLGILAGLVLFGGQAAAWQTVVGTGFCGGYTTFSTASFETVRLVQQQRLGLALLNALGSLVTSVAAGAAGLALVWAIQGSAA